MGMSRNALNNACSFLDKQDLFYCHCCHWLLQEERGASEIVADGLNSEVLDRHNCWSSLFWLIVAWGQRRQVSPSYHVETRSIDAIVDWHYRLIVASGRRKVFPLYWLKKYSTNTIIDQACFGWLLQEEGERCPLHIELRQGGSMQLLISITGWLLSDKGERSYLCIESRRGWLTQLLIDTTVDCCERMQKGASFILLSRQGQLTQLLINITGWLLGEETETRVPFHIESRSIDQHICWLIELVNCWESQLTHLLIDINGGLLQEKGERIPLWVKMRSINTIVDQPYWSIVGRGKHCIVLHQTLFCITFQCSALLHVAVHLMLLSLSLCDASLSFSHHIAK